MPSNGQWPGIVGLSHILDYEYGVKIGLKSKRANLGQIIRVDFRNGIATVPVTAKT